MATRTTFTTTPVFAEEGIIAPVAAVQSSERQRSGWDRWALASGIGYAVAQIGALVYSFAVVVPTHAPMDAPPAEIAAALGRHADLVATGTYLLTVPVPFFLLFLGGLHGVLRRVTGGSSLAAAALASGVAAGIIGPFGALLSGLSAPIANAGGDPAVVKELDSITPLAMALSAYPNAVLVGATSAALLLGGLAPRWIGWTGVVLAVICLASTSTIAVSAAFPLVLLQMLLLPLWILAVALALLGRPAPVVATREGVLRVAST